MKQVRRYNIAIWRLVRGKGSAIDEIAILTGLTGPAVRRRYERVEYSSSEQELNGDGASLSVDDMNYFERHYRRSKDPEAIKFLKSLKFDPSNN